MAKRKAGWFEVHALNVLHVDRYDVVTPNGSLLPTETSPTQSWPQGTKSSKSCHLNLKHKGAILCANAKATISFVGSPLECQRMHAKFTTYNHKHPQG